MKKFIIYSVILICALCCRETNSSSEKLIFEALQEHIYPKTEIDNYRKIPFDSAVIYYKDFPLIFYDGLARAVRDTNNSALLGDYYQDNMLDKKCIQLNKNFQLKPNDDLGIVRLINSCTVPD